METASISGQTELSSQASGGTDSCMAVELFQLPMEQLTRVVGPGTSNMALARRSMPTVMCTRGCGTVGKLRDPAGTAGQTGTSMTASGKGGKCMGRGHSSGRQASGTTASGFTAKSTASGCLRGRTAPSTTAFGTTGSSTASASTGSRSPTPASAAGTASRPPCRRPQSRVLPPWRGKGANQTTVWMARARAAPTTARSAQYRRHR
mmetsp:Transcript_20520/g.48865  ORF Transcript_20520/g.48865 Transcript_20520/m.48865 type:complete len:206 (+) Transcript_20520:609-1226(+)